MLHVKGNPANLVGNTLLLGGEDEIIDWRWMLSAIRMDRLLAEDTVVE